MHLAGFKPSIQASQRLQTHAVGRMAIGIGGLGNSLGKYGSTKWSLL
jgi:hypothetical protein